MVKFVEHKGKRICLMDFSNAEKQAILDDMKAAMPLIAKEPPASVLGLVDVVGSRFDAEIGEAFKNFAQANKPYMKMTAVVGVDGIKKVIFNGVVLFTRRTNLVLKDTRDQALDWLATQ